MKQSKQGDTLSVAATSVPATNIILADIIYYFHIIVVLFVIFAPFTNIISILLLHITFCICLLIHWKMNSNVCSLTVFEGYLRGVDRTDTFTHQFIAPMYDISATTWCDISTLIVIIVLFISLCKIFKSPKLKTMWVECKKIYNKTYTDKVDKMIDLYNCFAYQMLNNT